MDVALERLGHIDRMEVVGRGDDGRVDLAAVQHFDGVVKLLRVRAILPGPLQALGVDVAHSRERHAGHLARHDILRMAAAHIADADNADSYRFHTPFPPSAKPMSVRTVLIAVTAALNAVSESG